MPEVRSDTIPNFYSQSDLGTRNVVEKIRLLRLALRLLLLRLLTTLDGEILSTIYEILTNEIHISIISSYQYYSYLTPTPIPRSSTGCVLSFPVEWECINVY